MDLYIFPLFLAGTKVLKDIDLNMFYISKFNGLVYFGTNFDKKKIIWVKHHFHTFKHSYEENSLKTFFCKKNFI